MIITSSQTLRKSSGNVLDKDVLQHLQLGTTNRINHEVTFEIGTITV